MMMKNPIRLDLHSNIATAMYGNNSADRPSTLTGAELGNQKGHLLAGITHTGIVGRVFSMRQNFDAPDRTDITPAFRMRKIGSITCETPYPRPKIGPTARFKPRKPKAM